MMPFFKRKHERTLSSTSSNKSSLFGFDGGSSSRTSSEIDLTQNSDSNFCNYCTYLSKSSYNDQVASILFRTKSRLSKTLQDVLHDHGVLAYFIQYMESCEVAALVRFWLDSESFRASALTRTHCKSIRKANSLPSDSYLKNSDGSSMRVKNAHLESGVARSTHQSSSEFNVNDIRVSDAAAITSKTTLDNSTMPVVQNRVQNATETISSSEVQNISTKLSESIRDDAVKIYTKYISQDASHPICIDDTIRSDVIAKICSEDGLVDADSFVSAQKFVFQYTNQKFFPGFLNSVFHHKYQIDLLTSGSIYLADILYNDVALFYYMEFMELEDARDLMEFWLVCENFKEQQTSAHSTGTYDGEIAQQDAIVIYDKYFSLQAICPLGFNDVIRFEVEKNICTEDGPDPDSFLKPVALVLTLLESHYLPIFLGSQLFYKYLSELANTIQGGRLHYGRKKRSGSESSGSEHSTHSSSTNTLLAMDALQPGVQSNISGSKILKNIENQDMRIDTGKFNPKDLWKRDYAGKLEMGRINNIGKFQTDFQPQPDKKASKLGKAVKRFVSNDEVQKNEDTAWQIAEMIVRDVCNLTMNADNKSPNTSNRLPTYDHSSSPSKQSLSTPPS